MSGERKVGTEFRKPSPHQMTIAKGSGVYIDTNIGYLVLMDIWEDLESYERIYKPTNRRDV